MNSFVRADFLEPLESIREKNCTREYIKQIDEDTFHIVELNNETNDYPYILSEIISIENFNHETILDAISSCDFDSINEIEEEFGDNYKSIIAQCLFIHIRKCELHVRSVGEAVEYLYRNYSINVNFEEKFYM